MNGFIKATILTLGFIVISVVVTINYFFHSSVTESGSSFGLTIGETKVETFEKIRGMKERGQITEYHVLKELEEDNNWRLIVDPEWWNNTVTLQFENGKLCKIRRNRIWGELP